MNEKKCPLQNIELRLKELYLCQKQLIESYHQPDAFRTNLNAAIQSLRNITFILQSEKNKISDFDSWYTGWQDKMKNDPIMKWLRDARNQIVKQSDLETTSFATIRALTYFNIPIMKLQKIPPFETTEKIVNDIVKFSPFLLPEYLSKSCVLIIERHWLTVDIPEIELFDIIAYGYKFLKNLIIDAHKQNSLSYFECFGDEILLNSKMVCKMNVSLPSGKKLKLENKPLILNREQEKESEERYSSLIKYFRTKLSDTKDLFKIAEFYVDYSKKILKRDKFHATILFLWSSEKGLFDMTSLMVEEHEDKYLLMQNVLDTVKNKNAQGLIFIGESWIKRYHTNKSLKELEKENKLVSPSEAKDKKEALMVVAARNDGQIKTYITPFSRWFLDTIIKTKKTEVSTTEFIPIFLNPILQFWKTQKHFYK